MNIVSIFPFTNHQYQLFNLWWMPNLFTKGSSTGIKTGLSRHFKQYPLKRNVTWKLFIRCGGLLGWSWWVRSHGSFQNLCWLTWALIKKWRNVITFATLYLLVCLFHFQVKGKRPYRVKSMLKHITSTPTSKLLAGKEVSRTGSPATARVVGIPTLEVSPFN